ncbi:MAG: hypothetical protein GX237_09855 [Clostridiales bacterium]|nr:hypothetical protein [Clostridiales bacterium]
MKQIRLKLSKMNMAQISVILVVIGLFLGVLFANMFQSFYYERMMNYHNIIFAEIIREKINYTGLFFYILKDNFKEFIVFWLLSITILGIPYMVLRLLYLGFSLGFFISVIAMLYGFKGILLILAYEFPHGLIYLPIIIFSLYKGFGLCHSIYYYNRNYSVTIMSQLKNYIFLIIFLAVLLVLGSFLEAYLGSFFLKKTLGLFI